MKALILTKEYPPHVYGGAGVHVEHLSRELAKRISVEVRCFGEQDRAEPSLRAKGYGQVPGLIDDAPPLLRPALDTFARCIGFASSPGGADVVHCHTWYSHLGGILHKILYGCPLVISIHSLEPLRPWKRDQLGRGYDLSSWVERTALEMADAIIAVSSETRADVLRCFPNLDPGRVTVIPNGIDVDVYRPVETTDRLERLGIPEDLPYLLFVGRVTRQKGITHLLQAIPRLAPDLGVVLCAGAPDTPEIGREVQDLVSEIQRARPHVYWIQEMVPRETAIQLYSHAEVFCCPSIYEPFGIINLEAMACETPVVATRVGGIKEVVVDKETGFLVPPGESAKLGRAIARLVEDRALAARMGKKGRQRVLQHFTWDWIAERTLKLYRSLL